MSSNKETLEIISKQVVLPVLMQTITSLAGINPVWGILFATSIGIINAWGDFGQSRINEVVTFIDDHKGEFIKEIIEGDDFKTVFLNVLERHMKESSLEKRKLLRNYLLNVGKGINPNFNEYTRINYMLDTISLDEIDFLRLWDEEGPIVKYCQSLHNHGLGMIVNVEIVQYAVRHMNPTIPALIELTKEENKDKNNQTMLSLGQKGLLYVAFANDFGSGQEARVKEITSFGKAFLTFIKE